MSEEIKEILEEVNKILDNTAYNEDFTYFDVNYISKLLNYITNLQQKVEQLEKEKDKLIEDYTYEYNLRHKLSLELSTEKDNVLELENIRKEATECIETDSIEINTKEYGNLTVINSDDLLNILNKGSESNE